MALATITTRVTEYDHLPSREVVVLTASDGETYNSIKFKTLLGGLATSNADDDAALNVTVSGQVATINWNGVTDKVMTLELFGIK